MCFRDLWILHNEEVTKLISRKVPYRKETKFMKTLKKACRKWLFLHCPLFDLMRYDLLGQLSYLPKLDLGNIDLQDLLYILLYGSPASNESENRRILEASIAYIKATNS